MNRLEAAQVLAVMAAPHPWDVNDDQAEVWFQAALEGVVFELGLEIAVRLVEIEERFPTPARFNQERAVIERARYAAQKTAQPTLPEMPTPEDIRRRYIAEIRAKVGPLGGSGARGHWHGGPNPCGVCGGIRPGL